MGIGSGGYGLADFGSDAWDFATSEPGGTIIGGLIGGVSSALTGGQDSAYMLPTGFSDSGGVNGSVGNNTSQGSSQSNAWSGIADYMKPYTQGEQGIYPLAQQQYLDNMSQGYIGQSQDQIGVNNQVGTNLGRYVTGDNVVGQDMSQANSFGDRYNNQLSGVDPRVQNSMNQFLGGRVDTNTLDGMQQAATNRAMVGYGDAVQDAGDMFTQQIAPSIRSGAMLSGQYGGSRQGIAEGVSSGMLQKQLGRNARDLGTASMDVGQGLYSDAYQQARDNQYGMTQFGAGLGIEQNEQGMRNTAQNAAMEQQGLDMRDQAMNRYLGGQNAAYDLYGRGQADMRGEQDFGWDQLANYFGMINGQGQESVGISSSNNTSQGNSASSGSTWGHGETGTAIQGDGYGLLEGAGYGSTIGQAVGALDFTQNAASQPTRQPELPSQTNWGR